MRRVVPAGCVAAAFLMLAAALPSAFAEDQVLFGDLQIFGQDFVSAADPVFTGSAGLGPDSEIVTGQAQLDVTERLSFDNGQLYAADSVIWWQGSDGGTMQNDLLQAYVSVTPVAALTVILGKQRVQWGTGYAFFPGDRINPPVNPQNRSERFYGLTVSLTPSASLGITASVRLDTAFTALAQLPGLPWLASAGSASSLPFLSAYLPSPPSVPWLGLRYALSAEAFLGDIDMHAGVTWQWQKVLRPSVDFSLDVLGFIVDGALAVEFSNSSLYPGPGATYASPDFGRAFPIATVGLQRTASTDTATVTATVEYLYDGTGYDQSQATRFLGDLRSALLAAGPGSPSALLESVAGSAWFASGEVVPSLGRHYGALSIGGSVSRLFSASTALVINLQDWSLALQAELRFTSLEGIDVFARAITAWGPDSGTEFGSAPVRLAASAGMMIHF